VVTDIFSFFLDRYTIAEAVASTHNLLAARLRNELASGSRGGTPEIYGVISVLLLSATAAAFFRSRVSYSVVWCLVRVQYLLDRLPIVFSGSQWPLVTATDF
jgi:hypothetical protein